MDVELDVIPGSELIIGDSELSEGDELEAGDSALELDLEWSEESFEEDGLFFKLSTPSTIKF